VLAGAFRFALEFVRVNVRIAGPFTVAHFFALLIVLVGIAVLAWPSAARGSRRGLSRTA